MIASELAGVLGSSMIASELAGVLGAYLKSPHVPGVARIFQAVLVAFHEEFQEKSANTEKVEILLFLHVQHKSVIDDFMRYHMTLLFICYFTVHPVLLLFLK